MENWTDGCDLADDTLYEVVKTDTTDSRLTGSLTKCFVRNSRQNSAKMMAGGPSAMKEATPDVQQIADQVRGSVEENAGKKFDEYRATHFRSQVVAGTNFFIKIHVGNEEYVHIRVFRPLPGQGDLSLHSHQLGKGRDEEIAYF